MGASRLFGLPTRGCILSHPCFIMSHDVCSSIKSPPKHMHSCRAFHGHMHAYVASKDSTHHMISYLGHAHHGAATGSAGLPYWVVCSDSDLCFHSAPPSLKISPLRLQHKPPHCAQAGSSRAQIHVYVYHVLHPSTSYPTPWLCSPGTDQGRTVQNFTLPDMPLNTSSWKLPRSCSYSTSGPSTTWTPTEPAFVVPLHPGV